MFRFIARHGLVRLIGGRAVPALLLWDLAMLANRARQIPVVERNLRRGVDAAGSRVAAAVTGRRVRRRPGAADDPRRDPDRADGPPPGYGRR
jgi:hypothetical protein